MKAMIRAALPAAALLLGGCAAGSYCEGEQKYQKAQTLPPLRAVEGLQLPESASALRIPPPPAQAVPYGEPFKNEDGDDAVRCLDRPPEMPAPAEPNAPAPADAAPAAAPPPAPQAETPKE